MAKGARGGKNISVVGGGGISAPSKSVENAGLLEKVTDNTDFNAWIKENLKDPDFKQFGRSNGMDAVKELWYEKRASEELKNVHEMDIEDAIAQVREAVPNRISSLWFREANSDAKPILIDNIMANKGTLNAGFNIAYNNYTNEMAIKRQTPQPFNKWLVTPQTIYRGDRGQDNVKGDIFLSFTPDKKVAASFTLSDSGSAVSRVKDDFSNIDKSKMTTLRIRPIDTWGSYQTTAEQEFLVPIKKVKK